MKLSLAIKNLALKSWGIVCLLCWCVPLHAKTFPIGKFSDDYRATVTVTGNDEEVFKPGYITVYDKSGKKLIRVDSDELAFEVSKGKAHVNVKELPYGEQSLLIYQDFNFDGIKDLALMDGQNSCYHGPSFQIYLGKQQGGFQLSPDFTTLAQENCGMFDVDEAKHQIHTMTKSGCCWHRSQTYVVVGNRPQLLQEVVESYMSFGSYLQTTTTQYRKGKPEINVAYSIAMDGSDKEASNVVISFSLLKRPEKRVMIFPYGDGGLDYALVSSRNDHVEFSALLAANGYLSRGSASKTEFDAVAFSYADEGELSFLNGEIRYTIIDRPGRLGVEVKQPGKTIFLEGNPDTRKGSLRHLDLDKYPNIQPAAL